MCVKSENKKQIKYQQLNGSVRFFDFYYSGGNMISDCNQYKDEIFHCISQFIRPWLQLQPSVLDSCIYPHSGTIYIFSIFRVAYFVLPIARPFRPQTQFLKFPLCFLINCISI